MEEPAPARRSLTSVLSGSPGHHASTAILSRRVEGELHRCTRAELTARASHLASALAATGLAPGDRVATLAWNSHRHLEVALAAGATALHAHDPQHHPDRIVRAADDAGVRIVFFDLSFMPLIEGIAHRLTTARTFVALSDRANMPGPTVLPDLLCYEDLVARAPHCAGRPAPDGNGITLSFGFPDGPKLLSDDIVLAAVPMSRAEGRALVSAAWAAGADLVLPGPWLDGGSLYKLLEAERVTVAAAPAQLWRRLLAHVERVGAPLAGLRRAIVIDDAAGPGAIECALCDRYGLTVLRFPNATHSPGGGRGGALADSVGLTKTATDTMEQSQ